IIDVSHTDLHPFSKARATSEIASKDCAREAVLRSVGELERLVLATGANDRGDGADDFLARQPHVVPHVGEHMRRQYATGWRAAAHFARAGTAGVLDARDEPLELRVHNDAIDGDANLPWCRNFSNNAASTASSRSASSSTTNGPLPPGSRSTRLMIA